MSEYATPVVFVTDENHPNGYLINEADFDKAVHTLATEADTAKKPASMTVAQLKDALTAKGIEFADTSKKPELQALLDASEQ
jgi:PHD/YefM family antitoxin component YafN of YafNO toxin-antitoxin module